MISVPNHQQQLSGNKELEKDFIIEYKLKQAREFETKGKYLHSIQIYHALINDFPDFIDAYIYLASIYEQINNLDSAEEIFKQVLSIAPDDADIQINFAQLLIRKMDWSGAIILLNNMNPEKHPIISFLIGISYLFLNEHDLAKINFLNFVASDEQPELICEAYLFLAKIDLHLNKYENALKYIRRAETFLDDYWELYLLYARLYFEQEMFTHSLEYLQKAVSGNSKNIIVNYWAGKIYLKMNENKKAQFYMNHYLDLIEESASADYIDKTKKHLKSGKFKDALISFEIADYYINKKNFVDNPGNPTTESSQKLDGTDD